MRSAQAPVRWSAPPPSRPVVLVAALMITGLLVDKSPEAEASIASAASDPESGVRTATLGEIEVRATLTPLSRGPNTITVQLRTPAGEPTEGVAPPVLRLSSGTLRLGTVPLTPVVAGTYTAQVVLPAPGTWQLHISLRISEFANPVTSLEFEVPDQPGPTAAGRAAVETPHERTGLEGPERRPRWTRAQQCHDVSAVLPPIRELVAGVPPPGGDHRENKPTTLLKQPLVDTWIARADVVGRVRDVELDGPTAARLEVDEDRTVLRAEEVSRMGFAVQQLLGRAAADRARHALQRAEEKLPVGLREGGSLVSVRDQPHRLCDAFRHVRRRDLDASHPLMQAMERVGVLGW